MDKMEIPPIGLGTWQLKGKACTSAVLQAVEIGYRMIDTAQIYGNEAEVGQALQQNTIEREKLFIATKVWATKLSSKKVKSSTTESMAKLGIDYLDLLYIHWPALTYNPQKTLGALSDLVEEGIIRRIGVSNFTIAQIQEAEKVARVPIYANQVEHHPFLQQLSLRKYLNENKIRLVAYSPLARGDIYQTPLLKEIGTETGASPSQVVLAWLTAHGAVPIPKASSHDHLADNFKALTLKLDKSQITRIDAISPAKRKINPPLLSPKWDE